MCQRCLLLVCVCTVLAFGALGCGPGSTNSCDEGSNPVGEWVTGSLRDAPSSKHLSVHLDDMDKVSSVTFTIQSNQEVALVYWPFGVTFSYRALFDAPLNQPSTENGARRLSDPATQAKIEITGPFPTGTLAFVPIYQDPEPLEMSAYISTTYAPPPPEAPSLGYDYCSFPNLFPSNAYCGDGLRSSSEQCDDSNRTSGDGCTDCVVELSYCAAEPERWYTWNCGDGSGLGPDVCAIFVCTDFSESRCGDAKETVTRAVTLGLQRSDADVGVLRYVGGSPEGIPADQVCGGQLESAIGEPTLCNWNTTPCAWVEPTAQPFLGWQAPFQAAPTVNCTPSTDPDRCRWSDPLQLSPQASVTFQNAATAIRWQHDLILNAPFLIPDPQGGWLILGLTSSLVAPALDNIQLTEIDEGGTPPSVLAIQLDADGEFVSSRRLPIQGFDYIPVAASITADGHLWLALRYGEALQLPSGAFLSTPNASAYPVAVLRMDLADDSLFSLHTTDPEQLYRFDTAVLRFAPPTDPSGSPSSAVLVASDSANQTAFVQHLQLAVDDPTQITSDWQAVASATAGVILTDAAFDDAGSVYIAGAATGEPTFNITFDGDLQSHKIEGAGSRAGGLLLSLSDVDGAVRWSRHYVEADRGPLVASVSWIAPDQLRYTGVFDEAREGGEFKGVALATLDTTNAEPTRITPIADLNHSCVHSYFAIQESAWAFSHTAGTVVARSRCEDGTILVSSLAPDESTAATEVLGLETLGAGSSPYLRTVETQATAGGDVVLLHSPLQGQLGVADSWQVTGLQFTPP